MAAGVYGPTINDMKLPDSRANLLSNFADVPGLKRYESDKDGLIEFNIAGNIATGTGTNITAAFQKVYNNISAQVDVNGKLGERAHSYFANNTDRVNNTVYLPNS